MGAVSSVADLRDRTLPRGLGPGTVNKLLASCDRRTLAGLRDYAILLLLARLGLRAGEVAGLRLDDVDWRHGELLVRGKGGRQDVLPLAADVGEALVAYLRRRPRCECRALFLRVTAPRRELNRCTIGWVVRAAVVAVTPQDSRAWLRVERCFAGQVYVVTAPIRLSTWPYQIAYEWGALIKALVVQRGC